MIGLIKSEIFLLLASGVGLLIFFGCAKREVVSRFRTKFFALSFYCATISFLSPNYYVFYIAAALIVPLFARNIQEAAPVYLFALLVLPAVPTPFAVAGTYLLSLSAIVTLTLGAAAYVAVKGGVQGRRWSFFTTAILMFFVLFVVPSGRLGSPTNVARVATDIALSILLPFYIVSNATRSLQDVRLALVGVVAAGASLVTFALYEAKATWPIYRQIYSHYGVVLGSDVTVKMRGGLLRSAGPFSEPLSFAYWLVIVALAAFASRWMFKSRPHYLAVVGLLFIGLLAPQSRGAFLGLGAGLVLYQLFLGRFRAVAGTGVALAALGTIVYAAALSVPRIGSIVGISSTGVVARDYRQNLFERGMEEAQKNLIFGADISYVMSNLTDLYQGEGIIDFVNTYLYVLLVSGVVGVIVFVATLMIPVLLMWQTRSSYPKEAQTQVAYVAGSLCAIAFMLAFTSLVSRSMIAISVLLALGSTLTFARSKIIPRPLSRTPRTAQAASAPGSMPAS